MRPFLNGVRDLLIAAVLLSATMPVAGQPAPETRNTRVGVLVDNYPFSFRGADGRMQGFAYELLQEIEQVMGLRFERIQGSTAEINDAFRERRVDLLQSFARSPERESTAEFSVPYLTMTGQVFVREGGPDIKTLADLKGRKVLVHRGSLGEQLLQKAGLGDTVTHAESVEQALVMLDRGEGDATLATRLTGLALAHRLGLTHLRVLDVKIDGYEVAYCVAVQKDDHVLLARINEGMALLVHTGRFDELYRKWFGFVTPVGYTAEHVLLAVAVGLALALGVAVWAVVRQRTLAKRIASQAEALRESEDRLRLSVAASNIGLWDWNLVTDEVHFSREWKGQLGYAEDEIPDRFEEWRNRIHPDDLAPTLAKMQRFIAEPDGESTIEVRLRHKDGSYRWMFTQAQVFRDAANKPTRMMGCHIDITARKQVEEEIRRSNERFQMVARATNDAVWDWNLGTNALWWNEGYQTLFGYRPEETDPGIGSWKTFIHADDVQRVVAGIHEVIDHGGHAWSAEYRFRRRDGTYADIFDRGFVLRDAAGQATRMIGAMQDFTARKQAEAAVQRSESSLAAAQALVHLGSWELDLATMTGSYSAEMFRLLYRDPALGVPPFAELLELVHPDDRRTIEEAQARTPVATSPYTIEYRTHPSLGPLRQISATIQVLRDAHGQPVRTTGTALDITGRKQAEEEIRTASEQLRALAARLQAVREQERTDIAREIHDVLAQELTRLKIDLVWLAKRVARPLDEPVRATVVVRIADAIAQTDTAIATVQRIATELRPVILDSLSLPAAVEWQAEDFARRTGIACRARVPAGDTALARDRATAIFRILQESLTNVARHAHASTVAVEFIEETGTATLTVRDNGVGISGAQMADPRSIGLLGMRERALAFGGTVEIFGSPGTGTVVTVRIPMEEQPES